MHYDLWLIALCTDYLLFEKTRNQQSSDESEDDLRLSIKFPDGWW